jgi:hypothetical protein
MLLQRLAKVDKTMAQIAIEEEPHFYGCGFVQKVYEAALMKAAYLRLDCFDYHKVLHFQPPTVEISIIYDLA